MVGTWFPRSAPIWFSGDVTARRAQLGYAPLLPGHDAEGPRGRRRGAAGVQRSRQSSAPAAWYPPKTAISALVNSLTGVPTRRLRTEFTGQVNQHIMHGHFWPRPPRRILRWHPAGHHPAVHRPAKRPVDADFRAYPALKDRACARPLRSARDRARALDRRASRSRR